MSGRSRSLAEKLTTADVNAALRLRYVQPEWALMFEVAVETGMASRYADAVAMNMYSSRGLAVHGFEVKVSRSDWLRELKNPAKADAIAQYCDAWWIATLPGIVLPGELPDTWGLMELRGKKLQVVTKAGKRRPVPLDRGFVAAMLRRANEVDEATVASLVAAGLEQRTTSLRDQHESELRMARSDAQRMQKQRDEVLAATGVDLYSYHGSVQIAQWIRVAKALNLLGSYGPLQALQSELRAIRKNAGELEGALQDAIADLMLDAPVDGGAG